MTKHIDADLLRKEIDRIEEEARKVRVSGTDKEAIGADGKVKLCLKLKSIIDSLQQEQPEVDLEKASRNVYESWMGGTMNDVRRDMVELGKVLNARKED